MAGPSVTVRPLRVGFLTYGLDRPLSGTTRVALELGRALLARDDVEVTFLRPYRRGYFAEPGVRSRYLPGCRLVPGLLLLGGPLLETYAAALDLDVVHDPIGIAPFAMPFRAARARRLTTIYDAIAFEFPQGYPFLNNLVHRRYVPFTVGHVDAVATSSAYSAAVLGRYLRFAANKVRVIPLGVSPAFRPPQATPAAQPSPYLLYVGAFKAHKNLTTLLAAFARIRERLPDHRLVLVGPSQWSYPELDQAIADLRLADAVQVRGFVPEAELPALYAGASMFVLPSLYEGFGLPVLEAMACGTPVVCTNATSVPEVADDAAVMVDPLDVDALGDAILRLCLDRDLSAQLRTRGLAQAARFSWSRTAEEYVALYRELASR